MSTRTLNVNLGPRSYSIVIGHGVGNDLGDYLNQWVPESKSALVVTDTNVRSPHAERVVSALEATGSKVRLAVQPAGETAKSLEVCARLYDELIEMQADRKAVVIAVGGGVVGDAAGFIAATYSRGIPFVQYPTTLLAAVDSSVGGKVGVNHRLAKNMIGAFHQPRGVLIDLETFATLPDREYRAGLAEVVKYGVILDDPFFQYLEISADKINRRDLEVLAEIVYRSCRLKADVVEQDEFERNGLRAVLNYGHTFAHAFEALAEYGRLLHGEAVSIGMIYASRLAARMGWISDELTSIQETLLLELGLPTRLPKEMAFPESELLARMRLDKKSVGGQLRFVLPRRIGFVETGCVVEESLVKDVIRELSPS